MYRVFSGLFVALFLLITPAAAQQRAWIQVEARPSLAQAQERVRDYARLFRDVNGFSLGNGWYAIALGPYAPEQARTRLSTLIAQGRVPRDSYLAFERDFARQFWPVGAALTPRPSAPATPAPATQTPTTTQTQRADETPREARASESTLSKQERRALQTALKSEGFYTSRIDGAFGKGTRRAMAAWQEARGYEATGILTTNQRARLTADYNRVLTDLQMRPVHDAAAGIRIEMPTRVVEYEGNNAPFSRYRARDSLGAHVVLISQKGDQTRLFGLYDIMQTLAIVPTEGARKRTDSGFVIAGENNKITSHTEARLENGEIKGFTLVWPAGDEKRRARVLERMQKSFERLPGTLPAIAAQEEQSVDLVSGLNVRRPTRSLSGIHITQDGQVITALAPLQNCTRITLEQDTEARIVAHDPALGLALIAPKEAGIPIAVGNLQSLTPRLNSDVAVAGYSYGGVLTAPTLTFGTLADLRDLQGREGVARLSLRPLPGDAGGPVLDENGAVIGMLLPPENGPRRLPTDVSFALRSQHLSAFMSNAGHPISPAPLTRTPLDAEDLTRLAQSITALVNCWGE